MKSFENLCQILEQECDHDRRLELSIFLEQENSALIEANTNKELQEHDLEDRINTYVVEANAEEGPSNNSKKQEHNAKEKVRRKKLNATYLALGALLPNYPPTKPIIFINSYIVGLNFFTEEKINAPVLIDRAVEYIPELEKEIEKLSLRKNNLVSAIEKQKYLISKTSSSSDDRQVPSVSIHEVVKGEQVIIRIICIQKDHDQVSNLLQNVQAQGMCILSASTLQVCEERVSYHLHLQEIWVSFIDGDQTPAMKISFNGDDSISSLKMFLSDGDAWISIEGDLSPLMEI
ncbi:hypothetical protein Q3G72_000796 [Acer saccharum]|nr:hypothetical protein Q3G72_000796 [Acer saccharum]